MITVRWVAISAVFLYTSFVLGQAEKRVVKLSSEKEINQVLLNYYGVMSDRDWVLYKEFFVDQGTLTTIWKMESETEPVIHTYTIDQFLAQTKDGPDSQPIFEEKMLDAEIDIKGNLAQAWVHYEAKFGTEANLTEWKGMDLFSFIKFKDAWKIVSIVYESD